MGPRKPLESTRPIPGESTLEWRAAYLRELRSITPSDLPLDEATIEGLAPGNKKTGTSGTKYKTVFVWNLPAIATCPGRSDWCVKHCYNADERADVFPVDKWRENWAQGITQRDALRSRICEQLAHAPGPVAVRLHSSGDFFSASYVNFWKEIAGTNPSVSFWAYTRSWSDLSIRPSLEELRRLANVQLFASWDNTMTEPPEQWRISVVIDDLIMVPEHEIHAPNIVCPEQIGATPNCASCGYCIHAGDGNVTFILH